MMGRPTDKYMILNGELVAERPHPSAYIYQNIHTLNHKAYFVAQHLDYLNRSAKELFGTTLPLSARQLEVQISQLLSANRLTRNATIKVELALDVSGDYTLRCDEPTIYAGYVMRSLRPTAVCVPANMPLSPHSTSATIATRLFADAIARTKGYHIAIIAERDGGIAMEPCSPLFIIKGYTMHTAEGCRSVEVELAERAATLSGLQVEHHRLMIADLADADEVIMVDWQGVSAISEFAKRPYMDILAHNIAKELERIADTEKGR